MNTNNNTTKKKKITHLSLKERVKIEIFLEEDENTNQIAKKLGRSYNCIKNELQRGTIEQIKQGKKVKVYYAEVGQRVYEERRQNCGRKMKLLDCEEFIDHLEKEYEETGYGIDAITGATKISGDYDKEEMLCTKTIYNYIDKGLLKIKNIDLPLKLKRSTKPKRVRENKKELGTSIDDRPESIESREEFGHWEIDVVIGKKSKEEPVLVTLLERKTRAGINLLSGSRTKEAVTNVLKELAAKVGDNFSRVFKSITADNGSEFADLAKLENYTGTKVYFAHPYSAFERGSNERYNGLIRRLIPKGKSLLDYSTRAIKRVQEWCNKLPRKILGYLTPKQAFENELTLLLEPSIN